MNLLLFNKMIMPKHKHCLEDKEEFNENDLKRYLSKSSENIVLVFGQKIVFETRSNIRKNMIKLLDSENASYFQIVGRHLVNEEDYKKILDKTYAIYNISTMKDVRKVHNENQDNNHNRSIYDVDAYTVEEYE